MERTSQEIIQENRDYTMFSWSVQGTSNPLHITRGQGVWFWDGDGNKWLDFSSQLINLNVGHQHPKVLQAIKDQVDTLCFAGPSFATEPRGALGKKLAEVTGLAKAFFTAAGAEANENAIKIARLFTGRAKIITRYRSYHGASMGSMTASGDMRRWAVEPGIPGIVRAFDPYCYRCPFGKTPDSCGRECVTHIEEIIQMEGPHTIAAIMVEGITGTNGLLIPPDDYYPKLRALCDKYKILLIDDEVMSGFGRTGRWLATQHYGIKPDIVTCAKGLTSGYMPLGAVVVSKEIADHFETHMLWAGLTYSGHPVCCATAVANLKVYEEEDIFQNVAIQGAYLRERLEGFKFEFGVVGDVRCIGLFSVIEFVKDKTTKEPLAPYNGTSPEMTRIVAHLKKNHIYVFSRFNLLFVCPPLIIMREELKQGLDVIEEAIRRSVDEKSEPLDWGKLAASQHGRSGPVWDPATGEVQAHVDFADSEEVDQAVAAASLAFPAWRATPLSRRAEVMFRLRDLVDRNRKQIAELLTREHGKTTADALGEVARGLENIEFACGVPNLMKGGFSEQVSRGLDVYQIHQPLGVVAGITPFNFPAMVPMWMLANAIACGNAFILKPSEKDPSVSLLLAELLQQAGVPDGIFTVVQGDRVAVDCLLRHPDVKAISFVGSTPVARAIYQTGTQLGKRVQALGGAKNHMLVMPDAHVDMAADAAVSAAYGSAGERCMAISVVVAVGAVADPLIEAIKQRMAKIKIGPGLEEGNEMGPLITGEHRDRVASYVTGAKDEGATVVVNGNDHAASKGGGFFLGTSLLDGVKPGMRCYDDEIFGPVLSVVRVKTYDEGLALINDHPMANGTAIFTRDGGTARQFQSDVEVGMVGINVPIPVPVSYYSFGGWKASLFGDLHMYGPEGIQFYTRSKVITSRWPEPSTSQVDLGFPQVR